MGALGHFFWTYLILLSMDFPMTWLKRPYWILIFGHFTDFFWARQEVSGAAFIFYFLKSPFHGLSNGTWPMEKRKCAYQGVKNVRFLENLVCFIFLRYLFWNLPFCLIANELILLWFWTCWTFMITNKFTNLTFFLNKVFIFWSEEFGRPNRYTSIKKLLDTAL